MATSPEKRPPPAAGRSRKRSLPARPPGGTRPCGRLAFSPARPASDFRLPEPSGNTCAVVSPSSRHRLRVQQVRGRGAAPDAICLVARGTSQIDRRGPWKGGFEGSGGHAARYPSVMLSLPQVPAQRHSISGRWAAPDPFTARPGGIRPLAPASKSRNQSGPWSPDGQASPTLLSGNIEMSRPVC